MKQVFTTIAAALVVLSAAAQAPGTESTVVGKKLNFEAPLFGVTVKNTKPAWTIVTFGEIDGGMSYSLGTPSQMKPVGVSAELSIVEWRYRPWRNGNIFTWGLSASLQQSSLTTGYVFDEMGEIGPTRESWIAAGSKAVESAFYVPVGYVHEFGKCKAGLFISPGIGTTRHQNSYLLGRAVPAAGGLLFGPEPTEGDVVYMYLGGPRHEERLIGNNGFRLNVKAGFWYDKYGITAGYTFHTLGPQSTWKRYGTFNVGLSVRY